LDTLDQFGSFNVVLVMFELALFNKEVIRRAKSGPVMGRRQAIFKYLSQFLGQDPHSVASKRETCADFNLRA